MNKQTYLTTGIWLQSILPDSPQFHATSLKSMACLAGIQGRIWTIINNCNPNKETQKKQFYK